MRSGRGWRTAALLAWAVGGSVAAARAEGDSRVDLVIDAAHSEVRFRAESTGHGFTGRTRRIDGRASLAPGDLSGVSGAEARIDAASLETGNGLRDRKMRHMLETDRYPRILFRAARFVPEGGAPGGGAAFRGVLTGELTVRGVTRPVSLEVTGAWDGPALRASGSCEARFTDFGMSPPRALGLLRVKDAIRLEFDVVAQPAPALPGGGSGAP